jgi:hypothetical protein
MIAISEIGFPAKNISMFDLWHRWIHTILEILGPYRDLGYVE